MHYSSSTTKLLVFSFPPFTHPIHPRTPASLRHTYLFPSSPPPDPFNLCSIHHAYSSPQLLTCQPARTSTANPHRRRHQSTVHRGLQQSRHRYCCRLRSVPAPPAQTPSSPHRPRRPNRPVGAQNRKNHDSDHPHARVHSLPLHCCHIREQQPANETTQSSAFSITWILSAHLVFVGLEHFCIRQPSASHPCSE